MIYVKQFNEKQVVLSDNNEDYILTAKNNEEFDIDILEEILKPSLQQTDED